MDIPIEQEPIETQINDNSQKLKEKNERIVENLSANGKTAAIVTKTKWLCFSACCSSNVSNNTNE